MEVVFVFRGGETVTLVEQPYNTMGTAQIERVTCEKKEGGKGWSAAMSLPFARALPDLT